ncbi:MAG: DUF5684 domain-containing protein [Patescibacteria group bacterium]|nr:DUF5684 domain-containing protein [Patescibacteria group bacterium]
MEYNYNYEYTGNVSPEVGVVAGIFGVGMALFGLVVGLAFYVYFSICLMKIAQKTNTENAWFAWIPLLNIILMLQIAKKPLWWFLLLLLPLINVVVSIIVWMKIAEAVKKPEWLGILMIVPVANAILPGYLAFSSSENNKPSAKASAPTGDSV